VIVLTKVPSMVRWAANVDVALPCVADSTQQLLYQPLVFFDFWKGPMPLQDDLLSELSQNFIITPLKLEKAKGEIIGYYLLNKKN